MTTKQSQLLQVLQAIKDQEGNASLSIHDYNLYPVTPESINPALEDLKTLQDLKNITSFERKGSRNVVVYGIITQ